MTNRRDRTPKPESWKQALERAQLGVWDWDLQSGECFYSPSWARMLGYEDGELTLDSELWMKLAHPDDVARAIESGDRHIAGHTENIETELRLKHKAGHWVWVLDRGGVAERDANGNPTRVIGVQTDITKQKLAEHQLEQINARFDLALAASGTGIWHHDLDSKKSYWDGRTRAIFGLDADSEEVSHELWHTFLHPDDRMHAEQAHSDSHHWSDVMSVRYRIIHRDGQIRNIETFARHIAVPNSAGRLVGTTRDITDEVKADAALNLEKERLRVTLGSISDAVLSTDTAGNITFANRAAARMLSRPESELLGLPLKQIIGSIEVFDGSGINPHKVGEIVSLRLSRSRSVSLRCTASPILSTTGVSLGMVYTLQDVTEDVSRQQELARAARYDALTGLLNRFAFDRLLIDWIAQADTSPFAVLYLDLDYFKSVNDLAGHAAGDVALKSISAGIHNSLPSNAQFARLGGDEFAILLPITEESEAEKVASSLLAAVESADLGTGVPSGSIGVSIGIAVIDSSLFSPADALACADDACYASKAAGRNRYSIFASKDPSSTSALNAASMAADVLAALDEGRLQLYGQRIHSLGQTEPTHHIEVLMRLRSRAGTLVLPGEFIPAAERFGIASKMDRWVIKTALTRFGWAMAENKFLLALNLSAQTLSDPHLLEFVDEVLLETHVAPSQLMFEITESAAVTNFEAAERFIRGARDRGCRVSLDDFGAGLSSFEYLRRFPIDSIKINGSFVENIATERFDREIVSSINGIAKSLGYSVVAEKIESLEVAEILKGMGIEFGQGFLFHKPEPLELLFNRLLQIIPSRNSPAA